MYGLFIIPIDMLYVGDDDRSFIISIDMLSVGDYDGLFIVTIDDIFNKPIIIININQFIVPYQYVDELFIVSISGQ